MNAKPLIERLCLVLLAILVLTLTVPGLANAQGAGAVSREYLTQDGTEGRAYSPAVATQGGKTVWLAGVTTTVDADGNSIAGDFEAQTHEIFRVIEERLGTFGGTLADIVTIDLNTPELVPLYDVYSHLVYVVKGANVSDVVIEGQVVMKNRELLTVDVVEVMEKAREIQARILVSLETSD